MNVTHNGVTVTFDRIAVYATADGSRTKEFPLRAGAEAPREVVSAGDTLTLVAVITPHGDETPDAAILREVREQAGELSSLLDDAA